MATKTKKDSLVITKENGKDQVKLEFSKLKKAVLTLRALNHPVRKQMLSLIESKKKVTVTDLYIKLKLEQSVASQHLAILRRAEVVIANRDGKFVFYSLNQKRMSEIEILINDLSQQV